MSLTSITSTSAASALSQSARWHIHSRDSGDGGTSRTSDDSASISDAGFAALFQSEQGGGCAGGSGGMSDDKAAAIGAKLQEKNPDLFSALDGDGDGKLSAAELKEGRKALRPEHGSHGAGGPPPGGKPPEITDDQAVAVGASLQSGNPDLFAAVDTDQDGTLSGSELTSVLDLLRPEPSGAGGSRALRQNMLADALSASAG